MNAMGDADSDLRRTVGFNILRLRSDREWTADELATRVDVDHGTIIDIESGHHGLETTLIARIAEALDSSAQDLETPRRPRLSARFARR
jgi:transcriptional regulator with XRE-family HTH domain